MMTSPYDHPPDMFDKVSSPLAPFWRPKISLFTFRTKYCFTLRLYSDQLPETLRASIYQTNPILTGTLLYEGFTKVRRVKASSSKGRLNIYL